jgi:hypothetical protein
MTKSITAKFGAPTIGKQRKSKQPKSTRVVKALPRKGVLIEFIGESPSKEWLTKGTKLACAAARARVIEVFQRLTTLKPAALGAEELTPEELPFLRFEAAAQACFRRVAGEPRADAARRGGPPHPSTPGAAQSRVVLREDCSVLGGRYEALATTIARKGGVDVAFCAASLNRAPFFYRSRGACAVRRASRGCVRRPRHFFSGGDGRRHLVSSRRCSAPSTPRSCPRASHARFRMLVGISSHS